jgi:glycosyltransferase involved in cell wall biosynthesis
VQFIETVPFPKIFGINKFIVKFIFRNNKKVFLVAAGSTNHITAIADFCESSFKYPELFREIKKEQPIMWSQTKKGRDYNEFFLNNINGVIPIMYEYAQGFRDIEYGKLASTIPIPMNLDKVQFKENLVEDKIVIFHGLNRTGVKGTPLIVEAMNKIKDKYPDQVEIIIDGHMPLDKYLKVLSRVNIVVDQVYSCSNGVNAIYSLALGKVVLGGGEPEALEEFKINKSPLIPIQNNVKSIVEQLEKIILEKERLKEIGADSRKYAEKIHDFKVVAQKYIDVWDKM